MPTASEIMAEFVENLNFENIPSDVINKVKLHIIDTIGIILGVYNEDYSQGIVDFARMFKGSPTSTILAYMEKVFTPAAALANSTMAHSIDYDDTHFGSLTHPSSVIIPTALAVAEALKSSGKKLLESIVAGYEIVFRLGLIAPGALFHKGFHPTSVIGVFGAAAVAGKIFGFSKEQLVNALGIAGSLSSGIYQATAEGIQLKPLHPGFASFNGILAAMLVQRGFKGPKKVFEGPQGFLRAYLNMESDYLFNQLSTLGKVWEIMNISIKPYPTCHSSHSSIEIAIKLKNEYGLTPEDIVEITYYLPKVAIEDIVEQQEEKYNPSTPYSARFSLPYLVITALKKGWVGIWDFTYESISNPEIRKHMKKVKAVYEPKYDEYLAKGVVPAKARVLTKDGKVYEEEIIDHKGSPRNPMSLDDVIKKFKDNVSKNAYKEKSNEIIEKILSLEKIDNVEEFISIFKLP